MFETFPKDISKDNPVELYVLRDHLIQILEMNISAILANRIEMDRTKEGKVHTDEMLKQRLELLSWVKGCGEAVYMSMHPASEYELQVCSN